MAVSPAPEVGDSTTSGELSVSTLALCAALAAATVGQGAFDGPVRYIVAAFLAVAGIGAVRRQVTADWQTKSLAIAATALAAWVAIRAITTDDVGSGVAQLALIVALATTLSVCRRSSPIERDVLRAAVVVLGLLVAVSGWIGAAFRWEPWGNPANPAWRASSTITYPNAAASVLVLALLVLWVGPRRPQGAALDAAIGATLVAGLLATQSRGGALALVVALAVAGAVRGLATIVRRSLLPSVAGASAFVVGLSAFTTDATGPAVIALVALGVSSMVAWMLAWRATGPRQFAVAAIGAVLAGAAAVATGRFGDVAPDRLDVGAGDRAGANRAAVDIIADHPVVGVGPGDLRLVWDDGEQFVSTSFVHNEYLQVAAELGLVGGVLLAVLLVQAVRLIWTTGADRKTRSRTLAVSSAAAIVVHSGLDFLWHIPVVPLLFVTVIGVSMAAPRLDDQNARSG